MKITLKSRILSYFEQWKRHDPEMFINGGEIERLALNAGNKGSTASRILRSLAEDGFLERRLNKGKTRSVEYRLI